MYQFSAPMPYTTDDINRILDINNKVEKSRITSLYASLPSTCELFTGFEQYRNCSLQHNSFKYWKKLICHSLDKNVDFIYLLNSPSRLTIENPDFSKQLDKLDKLLNEFRLMGVNKLRVSNHKLLSYLNKHYNDFNLYASTSFEFKMLSEYNNFMFVHPYIKQIVPSHDVNKNFRLLKNLKKSSQNIDIEIIANEGCLKGCPVRDGHAGDFLDRHIEFNNDSTISNYYYPMFFCHNLEQRNPINAIVKSNNIFPWEIKEYGKIGITKFKLVGRDGFNYRIQNYIKEYLLYLKGIDDINNIKNEPINIFIHHLSEDNFFRHLKLKECIKYLPDIKYFKKHGEYCSSICGIECFYCCKRAKKIEKILEKYVYKTICYIK